jgi:hypothetical protein
MFNFERKLIDGSLGALIVRTLDAITRETISALENYI